MQNRVDEGGKTLGQVAFEAHIDAAPGRPWGLSKEDWDGMGDTAQARWEASAAAVKAEIVAGLRRIGAVGAASELERSAGIPWEPPKPPPPPPG